MYRKRTCVRVLRQLLAAFFLSFPLSLLAQMPATSTQNVWITVGDTIFPIAPAQTQTEIKPGWKLADVTQLPDKTNRYVWGARSRQLAESNRPRLVLKTAEGTLHDFVIFRLFERKEYRKFPKADWRKCSPIYIDLQAFLIELLPDERYAVTPKEPLKPGEYIVIDTSAKPATELGDLMVYGFTVLK